MPDFTWEGTSGRYRDASTGRFVSDARIIDGMDALVQLSAERLGSLAAQLKAGSISAETFQTEMLAEIKAVHVASSLAAYGGREVMTAERWGYVGSLIRAQYGFARQFVDDIISGRQPDSRLVQRARQYAASARMTYENVRAREALRLGLDEVRNMLHSAEGCGECKSLTGQGWMPSDAMPAIGSRSCGNHCRCSIVRRRSASEAA